MNTRAYALTFISAGLMTLVGLSAAAESKEYLPESWPSVWPGRRLFFLMGRRRGRLAMGSRRLERARDSAYRGGPPARGSSWPTGRFQKRIIRQSRRAGIDEMTTGFP
jgi:hypothetical protein